MSRKFSSALPAFGAFALSLSAGALLFPRAAADAVLRVATAKAPAQNASGVADRAPLLADLGPHAPMRFVPRSANAAPQTAFVVPTPPARPVDLAVAAPETTAPETDLAAEAPTPPRRPAEYAAQERDEPRLPGRGAPFAPPRQTARLERTTIVPATRSEGGGFFERLFGGATQPTTPLAAGRRQGAQQALAYAAPETGGGLLGGLHSAVAPVLPTARYDSYTAVYDISARTVYLPNGQRLEAHSGLGSRLDDPRFVHERMRGPTPPHLYSLSPREALFHGVEALRLTPVGGAGAIFGRAGLLAHTYMLGPKGDSNGCVSFRDYGAFLRAYKNGEIRRLAVVSHL